MARDPFMEGFETQRIEANGIKINVAVAGQGKPLLLLHGHPQTHIVWRKVAPAFLDAGYQLIAPDLRGYGDSDKPASDPRHITYFKRTMAVDQIEVMRALGHARFSMIGHDRGGRVAHRLALDHPNALEKMIVVDIAPTATMYAQTDMEFARRYFWWFFFIQPYDLPESLMLADTENFLRKHIDAQMAVKGSVEEEVIAEYFRCYNDPAGIHAVCEDYRAAAGIDLEYDEADAGRKIETPLMAIWGNNGVVGQLFDVKKSWEEKATNVSGLGLDCGHSIPEELPEEFAAACLGFLEG